MSFESKTVIVTGATSGIGAETARIIKSRGGTVIGMDINEPQTNVDEYIYVDLSDPVSIDNAVSEFSGGADALCNVAGVPPTPGVELVLKINFMGLRYLTEKIVGKLNDGASIINVSSLAGSGWTNNVPTIKEFIALESFDEIGPFAKAHELINEGLTSQAAYPFSKEALNVWTIKNATRWADRAIRMNVVAPGPVVTPILDEFVQNFGEAAAKDLEEGGGAGTPQQIAPAIVFLASEESRWICGQVLGLDNGVHSKILTSVFDL